MTQADFLRINDGQGPSITKVPVTKGPVTPDDFLRKFPLVKHVLRKVSLSLAPRMIVEIAGYRTRPLEYSVAFNAHGSTNTASVSLQLSANPDFSRMLARGAMAAGASSPSSFNSLQGLSNAQLQTLAGNGSGAVDTSVPITIYCGYPQDLSPGSLSVAGLSRRFIGLVDVYSGAFVRNVVTFACRSAASSLVDTRITNISMNQSTTSFIAERAANAGLTSMINIANPGATVQQVLGYDQVGGSNFAAAIHGMSIWDLMIRCATYDDADLYEINGVLHYESPNFVKRKAIELSMGRDWEELSVAHSLAFNRSLQVEVHNASPRTRTSTTVRTTIDALGNVTTLPPRTVMATSSAIYGTAQSISSSSSVHPKTGAIGISTGTSSSAGGNFTGVAKQGPTESNLQKYDFYVRNQTPERVSLLAQAYRRQLSMFEYTITGNVRMTPTLLDSLDITSLISVTHAPYARANTSYYPRKLNESANPQDGWKIDVEGINHALAQGAV